MTTESRVWLITGTSSGFGRAIAEAALATGDTVIVAARRPETLDDLVAAHPDRAVAARLDVTDSGDIARVVADTVRRYGRIDVLVNNAGRGQVGAVEETTDQELRDLIEVHFFGAAALTRAVLPHLRRQGAGTIVQMSSFGGQMAYPEFSAYCATKAALEGFSEALAQEVEPFGVRVLIVEPGAFRTSFSGGSLHQSAAMPEYAGTVGPTREMITGIDGKQPGDPARATAAILAAVDGERAPLRLVLGNDAVDALTGHLDQLRPEIAEWEAVSRGTDLREAAG